MFTVLFALTYVPNVFMIESTSKVVSGRMVGCIYATRRLPVSPTTNAHAGER